MGFNDEDGGVLGSAVYLGVLHQNSSHALKVRNIINRRTGVMLRLMCESQTLNKTV